MKNCGQAQFYWSSYSSGWASSDYFLLCNPETHLDGFQFSSRSELNVAVSERFEEQDKNLYCVGICTMLEK
jgi:hypothetical protein